LLLIPASILMYYYDYVGIYFLILSVGIAALWFVHAAGGLRAKDDEKWAKRDFIISINYLMIMFFTMVLNTTGV